MLVKQRDPFRIIAFGESRFQNRYQSAAVLDPRRLVLEPRVGADVGTSQERSQLRPTIQVRVEDDMYPSAVAGLI